MKVDVSLDLFQNKFSNSCHKDRFSLQGLHILYDYLIGLELSSGKELELDVSKIAMQYCQYDSLESIMQDYGIDVVLKDDHAAIEKRLEEVCILVHADFEDQLFILGVL